MNILITGNGASGKSSLIRKFVKDYACFNGKNNHVEFNVKNSRIEPGTKISKYVTLWEVLPQQVNDFVKIYTPELVLYIVDGTDDKKDTKINNILQQYCNGSSIVITLKSKCDHKDFKPEKDNGLLTFDSVSGKGVKKVFECVSLSVNDIDLMYDY